MKFYFGGVTDIDPLERAIDQAVVPDERVFQQDLRDLGSLAHDGIPDDGIGDNGPVRDRRVRTDDRAGDDGSVRDVDRRDDDIAFPRHLELLLLEEMAVCREKGLRLAAIVPAVDRKRPQLLSSVQHPLQGVGELVLATGLGAGAEQLLDALFQQSGSANPVEPDDREVARWILGLLDEALDLTIPDLDDAEPAGIIDLLHPDGSAAALEDGLEIDIEDRVPEDDEERVGGEGIAREIDRLRETLRLRLLDEVDSDAEVLPDIFPNLVAEIANDDRRLVEAIRDDLVENMADDRLPGNVQQHLREGIGVRAEPASKSGNGDDCAHQRFRSILRNENLSCPQPDSNRCYKLEKLVSSASRRWGRIQWENGQRNNGKWQLSGVQVRPAAELCLAVFSEAVKIAVSSEAS